MINYTFEKKSNKALNTLQVIFIFCVFRCWPDMGEIYHFQVHKLLQKLGSQVLVILHPLCIINKEERACEEVELGLSQEQSLHFLQLLNEQGGDLLSKILVCRNV